MAHRQDAALQDLRVVPRLGGREHGLDGDVLAAEERHPLALGAGAEQLPHLPVHPQGRTVLPPEQVRASRQTAEALPEMRLEGAERQLAAVGGLVDVVAGEGAGERQPLTHRLPPSRLGGPGGEVGVEAGVEKGDIDPLPLARALPLEEGGEDGGDQAPGADLVGDLDGRHRGSRGERPGDRLIGEIVAGPGGVGAVLSPARDRADHQPGVARPQLLRRKSEAGERPRPEALDHHVGPRDQLRQRLAACRSLEIESHALHPGEEDRAERANPLAHRRRCPQRIAELRLLHLDYPRPQVRQQPRRERSGKMAGEVDDEKTG